MAKKAATKGTQSKKAPKASKAKTKVEDEEFEEDLDDDFDDEDFGDDSFDEDIDDVIEDQRARERNDDEDEDEDGDTESDKISLDAFSVSEYKEPKTTYRNDKLVEEFFRYINDNDLRREAQFLLELLNSKTAKSGKGKKRGRKPAAS